MFLKVFALFDIKADAYMTPFFYPAQGQAVRAFKDLVNDKNSLPGRHPGDYKLVYLGDFDDSNGNLTNCGAVSLGFGTDYVDVKSNGLSLREVPNAGSA